MNITTDTEERRRDRGSLRFRSAFFSLGAGARGQRVPAFFFRPRMRGGWPYPQGRARLLIGVFTPAAPLQDTPARGATRRTRTGQSARRTLRPVIPNA
ncbi:hypothetical protein LCGC14_0754210 [marine sediment metagenome]|uniref:Uncharacterized protein n=1 Tax=marine sediment metagenome TaxID=412755 RepID=A0A0F9SN72_9ZZZZ